MNGTTTATAGSNSNGAPRGSGAARAMLDRWQSATARGDLPVSEVLQQPGSANK